MSITEKFSRDYLESKGLPSTAIEERIISHSRWSVHYEIIFEDGGEFWKTTYSIGATEMQDEMPWEYETEITATQVEKKEVVVEEWVEVTSNE